MRTILAVLATIAISVYVIGLLWHGFKRGRINRSIKGRFHPQWTPGTVRGPKVGLTFWFLLAVCAGVLYMMWGK